MKAIYKTTTFINKASKIHAPASFVTRSCSIEEHDDIEPGRTLTSNAVDIEYTLLYTGTLIIKKYYL